MLRASGIVGLAFVALAAVAPSYLVERITEYYFVNGPSATYFFWSSERTTLFIVLGLAAAVALGYARRDAPTTAGAFVIGIVALLSLVYVGCAPRVCYSSGVDGLEPLRFGYFFSCLGIAGVWGGNYFRTRARGSRAWLLIASASAIGAITYYPVVFTMAGAKLLSPLYPIPVLAVISLATAYFSGLVAQTEGRMVGIACGLVSMLLVIAVTVEIAFQYLAQVSLVIGLMVAIGILAAAAGGLGVRASRFGGVVRSRALLLAALLSLLLSTVVFQPDAVAGVAPANPGQGSSTSFSISPSVYVGGIATQAFLRVQGVSVSVSFAGTNPAAIEPNNFLSGGLGVHAAGCCVDGVDYGYRFDAYLFHDGSEALVATVWEDCDWIMACGGHSWQDLEFIKSEAIPSTLSSSLHLYLNWIGRTVYWSYSTGNASAADFTAFIPPPQENAYFNMGTAGYIPTTQVSPNALPGDVEKPGAFFFQYGLMSKYSIDHPGWEVSFSCPSYLNGTTWTCISHSDTIQGNESYWKAIWRWGESYDNVMVSTDASISSATFSYSSSTTVSSFSALW